MTEVGRFLPFAKAVLLIAMLGW
ncbi:hypothetical protein SPV1_01457 [Mariprofundus ferrooxydans PV-1]|uniref:Uncharacterized protein n=1 Tax=Mariprofundus ferrooxydans PV-1 TaxID=314345 RepID=Q0F2H7_9PROT|nr:hypothetical protein SPV1_01457 [Mariprofundus ferrooxydans PV-1]